MMKVRNFPKILLAFLVVMVLSLGSAAFAGQVEIKGTFKLDGSRLIANSKVIARLDNDTWLQDRHGERVSPEQLRNARVIHVETDDRSVAKRIIILAWQE